MGLPLKQLESSGATDGQVATFDAASGLWKPIAPGGIAIFAQLSDSTDQVPADTNPVVITYNTQDAINGITHSVSVDPGELTIDTAGEYFVFPQPQVGKASGSVKRDFDLFVQVDTGSGFVDVPRSTARVTIKDFDITEVLALAMTVDLAVDDKIRIMQKVSSITGGLGIKAAAAVVGPPTVPATPSIIFSIYRIGA